MANTQLPIWQIHDGIVGALRDDNRLVLIAPTGSGKSTQVPQMILDAGLAADKRVIVLQPRRVAARTVAARVAWERGGRIGEEIGYQVRFDDRIADGTRIAFVTEGILLRWLQDDPTLVDIGAILFDEFHERNLLSDVALALAKRLQSIRPDLKLVVMSATLDAAPVSAYLGNAPVLISEGQMFPVEVRYSPHRDQRPVTEQAADAVASIINAGDPGDILVFMPGMGEINSTINALRSEKLGERMAFIPLHGELPPEQQDLAFATNELRKVVVATNVAETSVTIDGVRHVVDGGLARVARYDAERGIGTLLLEEISRASADQRKGRAGRTAPGTCHRLWTESGHLNRPEKNTPEIQRSDLSEVVLLLHSLGIKRATEFDWLDKPDADAVARAERLLHILGAIDLQSEALTETGRRMLRLPMHPRYSRMLIEASRRGCVRPAALCAALVSGRDLMVRPGRDDKHIAEARELFESGSESDFFLLMRAWQFARKNNFSIETCRRYGIHARVAREVEQAFEQILQIAERERLIEPQQPNTASDAADGKASAPQSDEPLMRCIVAGFVDQLCVRRDKGTLECDLTENRQGTLVRETAVQEAPLFVAATIREVEGRNGGLTLLGLATAVRREWLEEMFPQHINARVEHLFDRGHKRVAAVRLVRFLGLIIHHEHQREVEPTASGRCLADANAREFFELPNMDHDVKQFIARVNLVCAASPELEFPALEQTAITACLARAFAGLTLVKEAQEIRLLPEFKKHLAPEQVGWLDELVPLTVSWPDGRKLKLLYPADALAKDAFASPELQIKLHECFALTTHPRVCEEKVPVRLWLCGPDNKRIESTTDWPAFKATQYPKLRSALLKKYPIVSWL